MEKTTISIVIPKQLKKQLDQRLKEISSRTMIRRSLTAQVIILIKSFLKAPMTE